MSNISSAYLHNNINLSRIFKIIGTIKDPRKYCHHPFETVIMIIICSMLGHANNDTQIEQFGNDHIDWFKTFLILYKGKIPSHDTFKRVLEAIDPIELENLLSIAKKEPILHPNSLTANLIKPNNFQIYKSVTKYLNNGTKILQNFFLKIQIIKDLFAQKNVTVQQTKDTQITSNDAYSNNSIQSDDHGASEALKKHIILDGKALRAVAFSVTIIRAFFAYEQRILGLERVGHKNNEITALPIILERIKEDLKGKIISIDAIGTQTKKVEIIIDLEADYLLPVKGNQGHLYKEISLYLNDLIDEKMPEVEYTYHEILEKGHGRLEKRKCWTTKNVSWLKQYDLWKGLKTISVIETTIEKIRQGKVIQKTITRRYYISSLLVHAEVILAVARNHWGIENKIH